MKEIINILNTRFHDNMHRHPDTKWEQVESRILENPKSISALQAMEDSNGEPDIIQIDNNQANYTFIDCSEQSPDRRSLCYDKEAWEKRKKNKPKSSVLEIAQSMGVQVLDENDYFALQSFGQFDTKTSSWLLTPDSIREKGGAIFGDWRFGRVFIYHNGADSYYAARGFRAKLIV